MVWRSFCRLTIPHATFILGMTRGMSCDMNHAVIGSLSYQSGLSFCKGCVDVMIEGSFVPTWESYHSLPYEHVQGEIAYALPNTANEELINGHHIQGRIALVDRGEVPIYDKALRIKQAGGLGVVIVDNGDCQEQFECGLLGAPSRNGFLEQEDWYKWKEMHIPVVFILQSDGYRVKSAMNLIEIELPDFGHQFVTID